MINESNAVFELLEKQIAFGFLKDYNVTRAIFIDVSGHEPSATVPLTMSEVKAKVFAELSRGAYTVEKLSLCADVLIQSTYPRGAPVIVDISTGSS